MSAEGGANQPDSAHIPFGEYPGGRGGMSDSPMRSYRVTHFSPTLRIVAYMGQLTHSSRSSEICSLNFDAILILEDSLVA